MKEVAESITEELKSRGIDTEFSVPDDVDRVGVIRVYLSFNYVPPASHDNDEIKETCEKLTEAVKKEVLADIVKAGADFCEEYGVNISQERIASSIKSMQSLEHSDVALDVGLDLFI